VSDPNVNSQFRLPKSLLDKVRVHAIIRADGNERPNGSLIVQEALEQYFQNYKITVETKQPNSKK
jgi:hypothetical protein